MEKTTTYETACKVVPLALKAICDNGGTLPVKDVFAQIGETAVLNDFELGETKSADKTGHSAGSERHAHG